MRECSSPPISKQRHIELEIMEKGARVKSRARKGKKEGMRCREPRLHPSCGLVQKPFVPIVQHNLFSQRLQREGYGGETKLWQLFIFVLIT